jgi:phenylacetate-CoA ligase
LNAAGFPDRSSIEAHHLAKLQALLAALVPANAFYFAKLRAAGIGSGVASLQQFFERVPFTRKQELIEDQRAHAPYGSI